MTVTIQININSATPKWGFWVSLWHRFFFLLTNNFSVINNKISEGWFHTSIRSISPISHSTPSHKHKNPFNIKTLSIWLIFYLYLSSSAITSHSLKIYGRKITPGCTLVKFIQLFSVIKMYDSIYIHQHPSAPYA